MTADEVLEAMALALFDDHAERMGFGYRSQHLDAKSREIAIATWKPRLIVAISALPPGWVVAKVPGNTNPLLGDYARGWDAAISAVRASAVEVG